MVVNYTEIATSPECGSKYTSGSKNVSLHIWLEIHELCKMHGINNGQERALLGRTDAVSKKKMLAPY